MWWMCITKGGRHDDLLTGVLGGIVCPEFSHLPSPFLSLMATCDPGLGVVVFFFVLHTFFFIKPTLGAAAVWILLNIPWFFYSRAAFLSPVPSLILILLLFITHGGKKCPKEERRASVSDKNIKIPTIHVNTRMDGILFKLDYIIMENMTFEILKIKKIPLLLIYVFHCPPPSFPPQNL